MFITTKKEMHKQFDWEDFEKKYDVLQVTESEM